ncbi:hypothetical protein U1Q18_033416 [Sarracenia purpurea var. burkii]
MRDGEKGFSTLATCSINQHRGTESIRRWHLRMRLSHRQGVADDRTAAAPHLCVWILQCFWERRTHRRWSVAMSATVSEKTVGSGVGRASIVSARQKKKNQTGEKEMNRNEQNSRACSLLFWVTN